MKRLILFTVLLLTPSFTYAAPPLRDSLYAVLLDGTDRYNSGDVDGCRTAYRTALEAARPQLTSRGDLLLAVDDALRSDDPFVLREAIDQVRKSLKPVEVTVKAVVTPPPEPASCVCGESCRCNPGERVYCQCPADACPMAKQKTLSTSNRYRWKIVDSTWASLVDAKTGKQVGGYLFGPRQFRLVTNGVDGEECEPPIPPPTKPQTQANPVVMPRMVAAEVCVSSH